MVTAGYSCTECLFCLYSYLQPRTHGQGGKFVATFGSQKLKRMTKIKHKKKSSQKSDSLENETKQRFILQKWYSKSLLLSIFTLTLLLAPLSLKADAFSIYSTQWMTLQPENILIFFVLLCQQLLCSNFSMNLIRWKAMDY